MNFVLLVCLTWFHFSVLSFPIFFIQNFVPPPPPGGSEWYVDSGESLESKKGKKPDKKCGKWYQECHQNCESQDFTDYKKPDKEYKKCIEKKEKACEHFYQHKHHYCENSGFPEMSLSIFLEIILLGTVMALFIKLYKYPLFVG